MVREPKLTTDAAVITPNNSDPPEEKIIIFSALYMAAKDNVCK